MAWNIPNVADAAFARQSGIYASDLAGLVASLAGDGVLSGCGVTAQGSPDTTVAVAAGLIRIQGYFCYVVAANVTNFGGDASNPRIDLVVVDYNGTLSRVAGTAAAQPVAPAIPANSIALAQIYVPANDTAIGSNQIIDRRVLVPDLFDEADEFDSNALVTTGNISLLAWGTASNGTSSLTWTTGVASHPGIFSFATGGTSGNDGGIFRGASATGLPYLASDIGRLKTMLRITTAVTTMRLKFGYGTDVSDVGSDTFGTAGAWWEFNSNDSNKWQTETRNASTTTTNTDTGADVAQNTWYQLEIIKKQNGNIQFAKNGALLFEHSANLPTVGVNIGFRIETNTGAARTVEIDFYGQNFNPLGQRFT